MRLNIPDELSYELEGDRVRFTIDGVSTDWIVCDDSFIGRIDANNLNRAFVTQHLKKEIEMKNVLDEGIRFLKAKKYSKAIGEFDRVLFYDEDYGEALLNKSYSLRGQKHFVKSLRFYKRAINADGDLKDVEYHKTLLKEANGERNDFPKLKKNIYAGDEYFARGEFSKAVESYDRALENPSGFKDKILSKLLSKKATALLKLKNFDDALICFKKSQKAGRNDYAAYGEGVCQYSLGLEVTDRFRNQLDITKRQMLKQVSILNDLGFFTESLKISDYLYENHYSVDGFYLRLLGERKLALDGLNINSSEIDEIMNIIKVNS